MPDGLLCLHDKRDEGISQDAGENCLQCWCTVGIVDCVLTKERIGRDGKDSTLLAKLWLKSSLGQGTDNKEEFLEQGISKIGCLEDVGKCCSVMLQMTVPLCQARPLREFG